MRISNKIIALILSVIVVAMPVVSFANPADATVIYTTSSTDTLPSDYIGNATGIISVKNPESLVSTTSTKSYVVSAIAQPGSTVTLYSYNTETDKYEKMIADGGSEMLTEVGASGLYAQSVNLNSGKNTILVVATNVDGTEVIKLEITLIQGFVNKIKNFAAGFSQLFGN